MFDYRRFWSLEVRMIRGALRAHPLGVEFDQLRRIEDGELEAKDPLRFHHDQGTRPKDVVETTYPPVLLYSDRLIRVLRDGDCSGWKTYEVEIYDELGHLVSGYHGLVVTGRAGPIVDSLSPAMEVPPYVPGGPVPVHRIGIRFLPETWDGSDVFRPADTQFTCVTQKVRDALVAAKLTNLRLRRITEIELPLYGHELEKYERERQ